MGQWTYAEVWQSVADALPQSVAFVHGARRISWQEFDRDANTLAQYLVNAGLSAQSKVGAYLYNCPEFLVTFAAALKSGLVPFNVNYRYRSEELVYLLDNADAEAVIFDASFADRLAPILSRLPKVRRWIAVVRDPAAIPNWAIAYDDVIVQSTPHAVSMPWTISGDDIILLYTGGTTGMPKGVMWRQDDLLAKFRRVHPILCNPEIERPDQVGSFVIRQRQSISLIACPLMHATGLLGSMSALCGGGQVVFLPSTKFDAVELWSEVERLRASRISIVGAAFCIPMLDALEANPHRWDLSCVEIIGSSGAMWSLENKRGLLKHLPQASLSDSFSSSEALGMGSSVSTLGGEARTANFVLGPECALFTEDGRRLEAGAGERGMVAVGGRIPLGYYKDPVKSAKTYPLIDGQRWSMPGDWATVSADGSLNLLGRGSQCINTGGEKVFPEELEEVLKRHPSIRDAAVVGLPDPRFGQRICAVIETRVDAEIPSLKELSDFARQHLADYKVPRSLVPVGDLGRAPNGKLDYASITKLAAERAGAERTRDSQ
jgi:3-oxocholest-4-en-26-oate---CoA ligase